LSKISILSNSDQAFHMFLIYTEFGVHLMKESVVIR